MKLSRRVFNSPLIKYANFMDGTSVNLVRLTKPYSDGRAYAIYYNKDMGNGVMTITLENALYRFNDLIRRVISTTHIDKVAKTDNYEKNVHSRASEGASVPPLELSDMPIQLCKVHRFNKVVPNQHGQCCNCFSSLDEQGACTGDEYSVWLNNRRQAI